jgi:hypothetical protein
MKYLLLLSLFLIGCGRSGSLHLNYKDLRCEDIYSIAFCESIKGEQGATGRHGTDGSNCTAWDTIYGSLITCTDGSESYIYNGSSGNSCAVFDTDVGAEIICENGSFVEILNGKNGENGLDGQNGDSCNIIDVDSGSFIVCGNDEVLVLNGKDGKDAIIEVIDPCETETKYDEVFFRFSDDNLYAVYHDKGKTHLVELIPGNYVTTDGTDCKFEVTTDLEVVW